MTETIHSQDALISAAITRLTHGLSPSSIVGAYRDWGAHLAASPGKQEELRERAILQLLRLTSYAAQAVAAEPPPCIEPLPQDSRFRHPAWQRWPYNVLYQSFLLQQQWWWYATTGVRGVTKHHEHVVTFMTRQWLDVLSPSNSALTNPEVTLETLHRGGMNFAEGAANWWEDLSRLLLGAPPAGAEAFRVGDNVAATPGKVIFRNRLIELIQYAPQTESVRPEPLLIVPSWIMKYYILDLSAHDSLVRYLVQQGHTVFMISWKNPDAEDRDLGMEDYLRLGVMEALDAVSTVVPGAKINALGYCLGGTLLAIAAAAMARDGVERLNTATLLAAELDYTEPGELALFIDESEIAFLEDLMWLRGYLDSKQMAGAFTLLHSRDLIWSKIVRDYLMGQRAPLTDLMAWNADATRLPQRMHSEYLRQLYLDNDLAEGKYRVGGSPVALTDIRVPLFVAGTQRDHVSPWRSVYKARLLTDTEVTFLLASGGHNVGIVSPPGPSRVPDRGYQVQTFGAEDKYMAPDAWAAHATKQEGSWWPEWVAWLNAHCGANAAPPALGAPQHGLAPLYDAPGEYVRAT
ncbi:MAG TPA: alpha/beta fold hydrolase [Burkholderiales bacterium]|nr:alpha/beta fold hydrolase [Burkholderiales bacterium]